MNGPLPTIQDIDSSLDEVRASLGSSSHEVVAPEEIEPEPTEPMEPEPEPEEPEEPIEPEPEPKPKEPEELIEPNIGPLGESQVRRSAERSPKTTTTNTSNITSNNHLFPSMVLMNNGGGGSSIVSGSSRGSSGGSRVSSGGGSGRSSSTRDGSLEHGMIRQILRHDRNLGKKRRNNGNGGMLSLGNMRSTDCSQAQSEAIGKLQSIEQCCGPFLDDSIHNEACAAVMGSTTGNEVREVVAHYETMTRDHVRSIAESDHPLDRNQIEWLVNWATERASNTAIVSLSHALSMHGI